MLPLRPNGRRNRLWRKSAKFQARIANGALIGSFVYLGELFSLLFQSIRGFRHVTAGDLFRQMSVIGVDTIPIAIMTVGFSGAVLSLYSVNTLGSFGIPSLVGGIVGLSIFRETGPILVGVMLSARAGSAMTAEIGSMKVTEADRRTAVDGDFPDRIPGCGRVCLRR